MIKLDFSLETTAERVFYLNDLIENSEKEFTNSDIEKMGDYLLFYEKDFKLNDNDTRKQAHERVSKDAQNGIKSRVILKDKIEKSYDKEKEISIVTNLVDLLCIKKQKEALTDLKNEIKNKDYTFFSEKGLSKTKIQGDINKDLSDLNDGKILFDVKSHGGEFSKFDRFNLNDIDYTDEEFIYEILKNADYIERQTPPSNLFYICLDFINATKNIKFTKKQQNVLYMIRNGECITNEDKTIKSILKKYSNFFKKNKK